MSDNKMLIDATHPEETRVVVLRQGRVEEFDYESAARKQLRGNIYLAKVTRVEPALQAAFIDYGGNRHGFLAFNEIHPDYYQIPVADRIALLEEEAAAEAAEEAAADARAEALERRAAARRAQTGEGAGLPAGDDGEDDEYTDGERDDIEAGRGEASGGLDYDESREIIEVHGSDYEDTVETVGTSEAGAGVTEVEAAYDEDQVETIGGSGADDSETGNDGAPSKPRGRGRGGRGGSSSLAQTMARDPSISEDTEQPVAQSTTHGEGATEGTDTSVEMRGVEAAGSEAARSEAAGLSDLSGARGVPADDVAEAGISSPDHEHAPRADESSYVAADEHRGDDAEPEGEPAGLTDQPYIEDAGDATAEARPERRQPNGRRSRRRGGQGRGERSERPERAEPANGEAIAVEQVGNEDALEELPSRPRRTRRSYKIQEVIKRRQVMLIQVVKEERGNKGAALTTYLSLAGRYTVLMPNTARGGGISRKITNPQDRKRLKAIALELDVPEGMGLIIRTAGAARTKQEIRRDFEYLLRLWESVRELTLRSTAPSLVYEEGDLIKRSIRDLYNKDIDEVIVAGDAAFQEAKSFMRMLMPSHAKNVIEYKEPEPLFTRFQIERQLNAMFSPYVTLKSGGYLVINQTEALVAVDVNSGRSTREYSIEETALHTNLEASDEIARQLKLRDLAGLVVIDFIDMEEKRNNRNVERRLKDALRFDRARIQVGRISPFGLMEMSRQRLRTGVLEGSTSQCPHCQGTGIIRSVESVALAVLRGLEDAVMGKMRGSLIASTTAEVALYILNNKREFIIDMEARHGYPIIVQASAKLAGANFTIEKGTAPPQAIKRPERTAIKMDWGFDEGTDAEAADAPDIEAVVVPGAHVADDSDDEGDGEPEAREEEDGGRRRRRRRRGGRRGGSDRPGSDAEAHVASGDNIIEVATGDDDGGDDGDDDEADGEDGTDRRASGDGEDEAGRPARRRRRGRRGGRRNRERTGREGDEAHVGEPGREGAEPEEAHASNEHGAHGDQDMAGWSDRPADDMIDDAGADRAAYQHADDHGTRAVAEDDGLAAQPGGVAVEAVSATAMTPHGVVPAVAMPGTPDHHPAGQTKQTAPLHEPAAPSEAGEIEEPRPALRSRSQPVASEPRLERVKVGPGAAEIAASSGGEASASQEPTSRRGWWQRKLLGG
ncbi:MAG: Rne/Rng family ribonuclease [Hyphomicrobiaceae bacterium]|nr:Rne/Rng family ribonuclease [Hyphomicrobiaceae bacterium]